jgi:predicted transcriptional regulator
VFSVPEDASVHQVAQYFRERQVRSAGVLNANGRLIGVVSQSDISDKVAVENKCPAWMKVGEIMSRDLISVGLEMTLEGCLGLMDRHGVYHLLVADVRGNFRGMVSGARLASRLGHGPQGTRLPAAGVHRPGALARQRAI